MSKPFNQLLVIFGATGDLVRRKLAPSLLALYRNGSIPEKFEVIGVGRKKMSDDGFRSIIREGLKLNNENSLPDNIAVEDFLSHFSYFSSNMTDSKDFVGLRDLIQKKDRDCEAGGNYIFYLATPSNLYSDITEHLCHAGLCSEEKGFRRFVYEKPFGYDLESFYKLNKSLKKFLKESQIYRIDHYLGKETVQNILVTRFSNGIFEPLWNRNYIHHVEITAAEDVGVENRGGYYDNAGAMRDMVQNHLLQIVGLTSMEPPSSLNADAIRNEILKVLQSLRPISEDEVEKNFLRGQYTSAIINGIKVPGYREEPGVNPESRTETYLAMKFYIDNWRWGGVPFFIRTGKRLPVRVTEIVIHFKSTPHFLFHVDDPGKSFNSMVIRIQPDEGILLKFCIKKPGPGFIVENADMDFHYSELEIERIPLPYERLLADVMKGDSTLFGRSDIIEAAWKFLEPVQNAWKRKTGKIYGYPAGTWGPENADNLIGEGLTWRYPCKNLSKGGKYCEL